MNATGTSKPPCPSPDCPASHVVRNGTLKGRQRYHCKGCSAWFGETHNTPMYRLHTPPEEVGCALLVVMRRGSLRAAEEITGHKYETISRWLRLAAEHAERSPKCSSTISSSPHWRWMSSGRLSEEGAPPHAEGSARVGRALGLGDPGRIAEPPSRGASLSSCLPGASSLPPRR